ncbi:hypothetical protein PYH37_005228 [Sinorhizobium numidicum]|uniref:Transmembrane protein n=1 Tax=Sinorhizobium numidicum TaxID=680248 RepID=A0ABY8D1H8_9HYPH|nr:hypothetical protein [Sinorhizobium numidicum]WEX76877.1 hypothetical protein PYH37_005228 [Sinorhizobium numidicum]WEX83537.1 hypothetical protein PYH38_002321 [Sinorhizobium numidicum]
MFKKLLEHAKLATTIKTILTQWGLWQYLSVGASVAGAVVFGGWMWLQAQLPMWAIILVGLATLVLVMHLLNTVHTIVLRQKAQTIDIPRTAARMKRSAQEMLETIQSLRKRHGLFDLETPDFFEGGSEATSRHWTKKRDIERRIYLGFMSVHRSDILRDLRILATLTKLERPPFHVAAGMEQNPEIVASYLSCAADLMLDGNLDELKKFESDFIFWLTH